MSTTTEVGFTPLPDALARLEAAVSPLAGIVTHVMRTMHAPDETCIPNVACELAPAGRTLGAATVEHGSGAAPDVDAARAAALGEALERYCGMFVPFDRIHVARAGEIGPAAVDPSRFALFSPAQHSEPGFPFAPFTTDTRTVFVEGESLTDGAAVLLPAELVFLGRVAPTLRPIAYSTTSGLACGASRDEARLAALLELVERDAVMLTWNCTLSLPQVDWSEDPACVRLDDTYFCPTGLRYSVLDGSGFTDLPVTIAVLHGPPGSRAALALGAGCEATMARAWRKALSECFGVYRWLCMEVAADPDRPPPEAAEVRTFDQHMLFYASPERARHADFLDASTARTPIREAPRIAGATPAAQLAVVVESLALRGVTAYAVDVTTPDVAELGLHVARVLAPELCALDVWHAARFLGGPRLYRAAHDVGLAPGPLALADLNPLPHPFP